MNDTLLGMLATKINEHFDSLVHTGPEWDGHRISAGLLLIAARHGVDHGHWHAWLKTNINRSIRDCQKAIALAHAPDPRQKLVEQRVKNRLEVRRYRESLR